MKEWHSNESYWAVLFYGVVYCAAQGNFNFKSVDWKQKCDSQMKAAKQYFREIVLIELYKPFVLINFKSVAKIQIFDLQIKPHSAVLQYFY